MKETRVVTYPVPAGIATSDDYTVEINGTPLVLYLAKVNFSRIPDMDLFPETTPFAYFDMDGEVTVKIKTKQPLSFVDVRPKSYGVVPLVEGNTVSFPLTKPQQLSIEFDGDLHRALHLFASPLESEAPNLDDPGVIYFGPGVHNPGTITLQSNQTVYLAGGAYVYGIVRGEGVENVCVRGRGILSAAKSPWPLGGFQVKNCRRLTLCDIILLDSAGWAVKVDNCEDVLIDNFKEICCRRNCDGIDLCGTRNAVVRNSFIRNWDDAICIKGLDNGNSINTLVTDCILWSDAAQSIEIGYETQMEKIEDVVVHNVDILHHLMPGYACITIHNGDRAAISNVRFEDIRIEDTVAPLFDLWVGKAHWNEDERRGSIRDVHFKDIALIGGTNPDAINRYKNVGGEQSELSYLAAPTSRIVGFDADHAVADITFENVNILGQPLTSLEDGNFLVNEYVKDVRFLPPSDGSPIIEYTAEPAMAAPPVTVTFNALQSCGQDAALVSFAWAFGDGTTANGIQVEHTYTQVGNYTVQLTVTDNLGRSATLTRILSILPSYDSASVKNPVNGLHYRSAEGDFNFGTHFDALSFLAEGITPGIAPPPRLRHNYHALVYEGFLNVPVDGIYRFFVGMEFGVGYDMLAGGALFLHGRQISANNSGWGQIGLKAGFHTFKVVMFKKSGGKAVEFKWMGPGIEAQGIPAEVLFTTSSQKP